MATNRDLLKEAIADAKTVKETAIANAKASLEESFGPFLREKLAAKLSEMEETEENLLETEKEETEEVKKSMYEEGSKEEMEEELSLDELLAEISKEEELEEAKKAEVETEEEISIEDMTEDDLKSFIEGVIKDMVDSGELEAGHEGMENEEGAEEHEAGESEKEEAGEEEMGGPGEEEINLDELLAELEGEVKETADSKNTSEVQEENKENPLAKELEEAYEAINTLRSELQEINLLNAKLLYTNKLFRNKSLTESQKVKVLTAFDKAKTKTEAQLIYETLLGNMATTAKTPIKESLGSASKALGTSVKPIIEDTAFARMRELAGLTKK